MKRLTQIIGALFAIGATSMVVACAKSNNNGPAGSPPLYIGPNTLGIGPLAMAAGSQYRFYAHNQQWATAWSNYQRASGYGYGSTSTTSTLSLNSSFKTILKDAMGVCNTNQTNIGSFNCDQWLNGGFHDIGVEFSGSAANMAKVIIRSYPDQSSAGFNFNLSLPKFSDVLGSFFGIGYSQAAQATYNPMVLQMAADPINSSQGFQLTSFGGNWSLAWNTKLMIVVDNGKIEDATIPFKLQFQKDGVLTPTTVGTGTLNRCQTQDCGF